ncbi:hypothetical protein EEJ42_45095 [Streptomyces botrytidirepellens]|uniref:Uncharacterized protein n=1 Tax=Streptomyces botrytidirepellens TaxID=2486417 RepID=A0A3M8SU65_9ACTN|nr:hypothetical protein EEJ42_45095 [Streptomyces botrytidirepellens]
MLLREEPSISDPTSYAAVLAAVSAGHHRRSERALRGTRPPVMLRTRRTREPRRWGKPGAPDGSPAGSIDAGASWTSWWRAHA